MRCGSGFMMIVAILSYGAGLLAYTAASGIVFGLGFGFVSAAPNNFTAVEK